MPGSANWPLQAGGLGCRAAASPLYKPAFSNGSGEEGWSFQNPDWQ